MARVAASMAFVRKESRGSLSIQGDGCVRGETNLVSSTSFQTVQLRASQHTAQTEAATWTNTNTTRTPYSGCPAADGADQEPFPK